MFGSCSVQQGKKDFDIFEVERYDTHFIQDTRGNFFFCVVFTTYTPSNGTDIWHFIWYTCFFFRFVVLIDYVPVVASLVMTSPTLLSSTRQLLPGAQPRDARTSWGLAPVIMDMLEG